MTPTRNRAANDRGEPAREDVLPGAADHGAPAHAPDGQKAAIRGCLDAMDHGEGVPSRLVDQGQVEDDTARWIEMMRRGLDE